MVLNKQTTIPIGIGGQTAAGLVEIGEDLVANGADVGGVEIGEGARVEEAEEAEGQEVGGGEVGAKEGGFGGE